MSRIEPRALLTPPGVPDFLTRRRLLTPGPCAVAGRVWSGWGPLTQVEFSCDDGATWRTAELAPPELGPWAWSCQWDAAVGEHVLCCRATDATGRRQEERLAWNVGGYATALTQRVIVTVAG